MFKNVSDTGYEPLTHGVFFVFILQTLMATMVFLWANATSSIDLSRVEIRPVVIPIDWLWRWSCLWDTQSRCVVLCCYQCGSFGWHLHTLALYSNQKAFRALHTLFQFNSFVWCFFVQEIQTNIVTFNDFQWTWSIREHLEWIGLMVPACFQRTSGLTSKSDWTLRMLGFSCRAEGRNV